jgi:hypothetical protein
MTCQVYDCREEVITMMFWPDGRHLQLCEEHTGHYRSIAGSHMRFDPLVSLIDLAETPEFAIEEARREK